MKVEREEACSSLAFDEEAIKEEISFYSEEESFLYEESDFEHYNTIEELKCKTEDVIESQEEAVDDPSLDSYPQESSVEPDEGNQLERSVTTRNSLTCKLCLKKFRRAGNLRRHVVLCEGGGPYICNLCNQQVANRENLHRHVEEMHMVGLKSYVCHECGKQCTRKGNLKAHMATHTKPKRDNHFVCHKCGQEFSDRSNLMRHVRGHDGQECKECGMKFSRESLAMHMALHIQGKYSSRKRTGRETLQKCLREFKEVEERRSTGKARKKRKKSKKESELQKKMQKIKSNPLSAMWTAFNSG